MFGSIVRNFKNAGVIVNVSLCVQLNADKYDFESVLSHTGTGLEIHDLGMKAHRELLRRLKKSMLPRRIGEKFEDIAWVLAAGALFESVPNIRKSASSQGEFTIPYLCFLAEHLSKAYRERESRDVCISRTGEVFINSFAGLHSDSKNLGNYKG